MALIRICLLLMLVATRGAAAQDGDAVAISRGLGATLVLYSDDARAEFLGSGFVYGDARVGLTNAHVVGAAASVVVQYRDGRRSKAWVMARDMRRDIAVLQLDRKVSGLMPVPVAPQIGTPVIALGAPLGLGFTATRGIVAADPRQVDVAVPLRLVQHDAAINPGSSGGPLIDRQGRLVGMNSQIANGSRLFVGISYAISAGDLARLVPQMLAGTLPQVPALGLDLRPVTAAIAAGLGVDQTGLLVDYVQPGSVAQRAGMQPGDILLAAQGQKVTRPGDLSFGLDGGGRQASLTLWRAARVLKVSVDLAAVNRPDETLSAKARQAVIGFDVTETGRVTNIEPDSIAAGAGLLVDDQVLLANGHPVTPHRLTMSDGTTPLVLLVKRDNRSLHVIVSPLSPNQPHRPIGGNRLDLEVERF